MIQFDQLVGVSILAKYATDDNAVRRRESWDLPPNGSSISLNIARCLTSPAIRWQVAPKLDNAEITSTSILRV